MHSANTDNESLPPWIAHHLERLGDAHPNSPKIRRQSLGRHGAQYRGAFLEQPQENWRDRECHTKRNPEQPCRGDSMEPLTTHEKRVCPCRYCGEWHFHSQCPRNPYRLLQAKNRRYKNITIQIAQEMADLRQTITSLTSQVNQLTNAINKQNPVQDIDEEGSIVDSVYENSSATTLVHHIPLTGNHPDKAEFDTTVSVASADGTTRGTSRSDDKEFLRTSTRMQTRLHRTPDQPGTSHSHSITAVPVPKPRKRVIQNPPEQVPIQHTERMFTAMIDNFANAMQQAIQGNYNASNTPSRMSNNT